MKTFTIKDIYLDEGLHNPIKMGTILDDLFSMQKGIMPSGITVMPGKSGIGKTTLCIEILKTVQLRNPEKSTLFISVEMNKIHLYRYSKRLNFKDLPIFIFDVDRNITEQFIQIISKGWHLILIDSFQQLVNIISVYDKVSTKQAETMVIKTMDNCRLGKNIKKYNTSFLCTMHMTKTGTFAGSAYIKYMIDAMVELHNDEENEFLTYLNFTKNRDGKTNVRLYYSINNHGIEFNLGRYREDVELTEGIKKNEEANELNNKLFNHTFNIKTDE